MEKKPTLWLTLASLLGILVGAGISFGTALQSLAHLREDVSDIKAELKEQNSRLDARVTANRERIQALELEMARAQAK